MLKKKKCLKSKLKKTHVELARMIYCYFCSTPFVESLNQQNKQVTNGISYCMLVAQVTNGIYYCMLVAQVPNVLIINQNI